MTPDRANIGIAYLVGAILEDLGPLTRCHAGRTFLLLNPCLLYWRCLVDRRHAAFSAWRLWCSCGDGATLRAGVGPRRCIKPTALPLLPAALINLVRGPVRGGPLPALFLVGVRFYVACSSPRLEPSASQDLNAHFVLRGRCRTRP
jgi:hypothetical protein